MQHFPWDDGALQFMGEIIGQKTVKAKCNRRVSFATARTGKHVDCPECRAALQEQLDVQVRLAPEYARFGMGDACEKSISELRAVLAL